ncbi:MAG: recombinase zinc beta ribbon domain-containing protein, partial [Candidatus Margulisbacteria bacterium]|nr:recombinase zinc beta ribbon domain-containing protein [Candidatus Margulisiibacteriota bacterium]
FYDVQKKIEQKRTNQNRRSHIFRFSGLVRCANCNRQLIGEKKINRYGKEYIYYSCSSRVEKQSCNTKGYLSEKKLIKYYISVLETLKLNDKTFENLTKVVKEYLKSQHTHTHEEIKDIKTKIKRLEGMIMKTDDLLTQGTIDHEKYSELNMRYQSDIKKHQAKYNALLKVNTDMHIEALEVRKFLGNIHAVLPHIENKRIFSRLVNALTRNFFWDGEKLRH